MNTRSRAMNTRSRAMNTRSRAMNTRSRAMNTRSRAMNTRSRATNNYLLSIAHRVIVIPKESWNDSYRMTKTNHKRFLRNDKTMRLILENQHFNVLMRLIPLTCLYVKRFGMDSKFLQIIAQQSFLHDGIIC
jgi:hypothetical protein